VCITYSCVVNFHTLENVELFNTKLLSLREVSLEKVKFWKLNKTDIVRIT